MRDIILATVECARWDHRQHLDLPDGFEATRGVAPGHYTRPSLAGLHSGQWSAVVDTQPHGPTLADVLHGAGYTTAAVSYSPQTTARFGFDAGFQTRHLLNGDGGPAARGSALRERLAESRVVRRLKRRLQDKHATFENIPRDASVREHGLDLLRRHGGDPLFLWVHFMGSHRPYGWDSDALPRGPSTAAANGTPTSPVSDATADRVRQHYRDGLRRVSRHLTALIEAAGDATVLVVGDHGEELGEAGYWFHGGYRRRLVDALVDAPVFARGLALPDGPLSLLDLPAHVAGRVRADQPDAWDARTRRDHVLSVAPWNGRASLRYQDDSADLTVRDASLPDVSEDLAVRDVGGQLKALGYAGVG